MADMPPVPDAPRTPQSGVVANLKPVAVLYVNDGTDISEEHAQMIHNMVVESRNDFSISVQEHALSSEDELPGKVDQLTESDVGMIVIIEPRNTDALVRLPPLYPDIVFSIIGASKPLYLNNVRSIQFKEQEGFFMIGVLAALHSKSGHVSFLTQSDDALSRGYAYGFMQGAKYAKPDIQVHESLGQPKKPVSDTQSDVTFILDEDLLHAKLESGRWGPRQLITYNHDLTRTHPQVLTSLIKHYDLGIYRVMRSYAYGEWKPGNQNVGIGHSYLDYALNNSNRDQLPKEMIEQIEMIKDFVSENVIQVHSLK